MNATTQKFAKWIVRVVAGRVIPYKFTARGEQVQATKFACLLVSKNPKEYMQGIVPFSFTNKSAAAEAAKKFKDGTCWEISHVCFENARMEFVSCPVKTVVKLAAPTGLRAIAPTETEKYNYASMSIHPPTTLAQTMELLGTVRFQARQSLPSGHAQRLVDVSCKIKTIGESKPVVKNGKTRKVLNMEVVDDSTMPGGGQALVQLAVWDDAIAGVPEVNAGCCIVGCTATKNGEGGTKLNVWDSAWWITTGGRAEALTAMEINKDEAAFITLTSVFSGTGEPVDVSGTATPTCVVRLALVEQDTAWVSDKDLVFQMNRCLLEVSATSREEVYTRDGQRLFTRATVRDWTGMCEVDVLEEAVPALFGCEDKSEVEARLCQPDTGGLAVPLHRVNVRGVIRKVKGVIKRYIASIVPSPLTATISGNALVALRGLSEIGEGIAVVAPAERIAHCSIVGMSVQSDSSMKLQAHRIIMLVTGTEKSKLERIPKAPGSASDSYLVESRNVKCVLGLKGEHVHLRGYCDFEKMLDYRLDCESAVVFVSAVDEEDGGVKTMTVEAMEKVSDSKLAQVAHAMTIEYKATLMMSEFTLPEQDPEYWSTEKRGVKRMLSEPATPARQSRSEK